MINASLNLASDLDSYPKKLMILRRFLLLWLDTES